MDGLGMLAVDWGTSRLRVWALADDGTVRARASSDAGMSSLAADGYETALLDLVGPWLDPGTRLPVLVCGMAGARQGWREAGYRAVPCRPVEPGAAVPVPTADRRLAVAIIPGLSQRDPPDVMRGEETQLAGLSARLGAADSVVCLPGTHAKWALLSGGLVTGFTTVMTGELFGLLASQSILRHSIAPAGDDDEVFLDAVDAMLATPERLTAALFSVRAAGLVGNQPVAGARSRLSGLLIGAELAQTRELWRRAPVHLVGAGPLVARYRLALIRAGAQTVIEDGEALTLTGLAAARGAVS